MLGLAPRTERALWIVILLAAAALRFPGLSHHVVRGSPDFDEQNNFIRPIERMWREDTLDPTVYQGYAGLFNWLAAAPVLAGSRLAGHAGAYVAGRGLVAVFGLLNVVLVGLLARRYAGPAAGLFAGALLAASRLDVRAAHHITPDVLVGSSVLGILLLLDRQPLTRGREAQVGALVGLGAAVKYTGFLGAIPAGIAALLQPGFLPRSVRMGLVAVAAFALAAPYAVLELTSRGSKLTGMFHYYGDKAERRKEMKGGPGGFVDALAYIEQGAGPVALGLAVLAPLLFTERRRLLPAVATVGAGIAAMAPAALVYPRHVVPVAVVVAALAGVGFATVLARSRKLAPLLAVGLVALSLPSQVADAIRLTRHYLEPSAVELAAEWLESDPSRVGLVVTSLPRFALDAERFEVRRQPKMQLPPAVLEQFDYVVTTGQLEPAALPSFSVLARFPSEDGLDAGLVTVLGPPPGARTGLAPILSLAASASVATETAALAVDGDGATTWRAPTRGESLELCLPAPARVVRVEIDIGGDDPWPRRLRLFGQQEDGEWQALAVEPLRPSTDDRQRSGVARGQVFVLTTEAPLVGLRVDRPEGGAWGVAEVRVLVREAAAP